MVDKQINCGPMKAGERGSKVLDVLQAGKEEMVRLASGGLWYSRRRRKLCFFNGIASVALLLLWGSTTGVDEPVRDLEDVSVLFETMRLDVYVVVDPSVAILGQGGVMTLAGHDT